MTSHEEAALAAERIATARRVLTEVQFLTWAMAERGATHREIAEHRGVSKGTVTECLREADRKIEEAMDAESA